MAMNDYNERTPSDDPLGPKTEFPSTRPLTSAEHWLLVVLYVAVFAFFGGWIAHGMWR